ncbi:MAG: hypothetical protein O3A25_20530 [Acidobacteria bacterium]|nr:hypothetical protein [Acidobacteriota bacterium]
MAEADTDALADLLAAITSEDAALTSMLAALAVPDFSPVGLDEQGKLDEKKQVTCPECGHDFAPQN